MSGGGGHPVSGLGMEGVDLKWQYQQKAHFSHAFTANHVQQTQFLGFGRGNQTAMKTLRPGILS